MGQELRKRSRHPAFDVVELVAKDQSGNENVVSIMLRDTSDSGLGGVHISQEPLDPKHEFLLCGPGDSKRNVRIVWAKKVAQYVTILGFSLVEN